MTTYHVGTSIRGKTLVIQATRSVDYLSCEIYDYLGPRVTTKASLYNNRYGILDLLKIQRPNVYGQLRFAVVE